MKSFFEQPVLTKDPTLGLMIEDGIPFVEDMTDYDGPRGLAEILSWSTPVLEIVELHEIAWSLNIPEVRVLRVGTGAGGTQLLSSSVHKCLATAEQSAFAICDSENPFLVFSRDRKFDLVQKFGWMAIQDRLDAFGSPWALQVALRSLFKNYVVIPFLPKHLAPTDDILSAYPEWWGLNVPATTVQLNQFARAVAAHCPDWKTTFTVIASVDKWLSKARGAEIRTFDDFYAAYCDEAPLAGVPA